MVLRINCSSLMIGFKSYRQLKCLNIIQNAVFKVKRQHNISSSISSMQDVYT